MKIYLFILYIFLSSYLFAKDRVVLLSAIYDIDAYGSREIYRSVGKLIQEELSGYDVLVIHHARQEDLYFHLNNKLNTAVFWISHSNSNEKNQAFGNLIVDSNRIDVSSLFQKIHHEIEWVGVVGCKAKPILDRLKRKYGLHQEMYGSAEKTHPIKGLKAAIKSFKQRKKHLITKITSQKVIKLKVRRPLAGDSLQVMYREDFLGMISPYLGDFEFIEIDIPIYYLINNKRINLQMDSGINPNSGVVADIPDLDIIFEIESISIERLELHGIPAGGHTSRVYKVELNRPFF